MLEYTDASTPGSLCLPVFYLARRHPVLHQGKLDSVIMAAERPYHWLRVTTWMMNRLARSHWEQTRLDHPEYEAARAAERAEEERRKAQLRAEVEKERVHSLSQWRAALKPEVVWFWNEHGRTPNKRELNKIKINPGSVVQLSLLEVGA